MPSHEEQRLNRCTSDLRRSKHKREKCETGAKERRWAERGRWWAANGQEMSPSSQKLNQNSSHIKSTRESRVEIQFPVSILVKKHLLSVSLLHPMHPPAQVSQ